MQNQPDIAARENVNRLLDALGQNTLKTHLFDEADAQLQGRQKGESNYKHYVVETQPSGQREIYPLQEYTERDLTRIATRPAFRFRWKCKRLLVQAEQVLVLDADSLEFEHSATLLWADVIALSEYLGSAAEVDQLIFALHTAYAQHVKCTTPKLVLQALVSVFRLVSHYSRLSTKTVDEALDALERAGVDLNYPMGFGKIDG